MVAKRLVCGQIKSYECDLFYTVVGRLLQENVREIIRLDSFQFQTIEK
jgi:hypothetical protein